MTPTISPHTGHIHALLAERGYDVTEPAPDSLRIRDVESGVSLQAIIEGDIVYFSLPCVTVPRAKITADVMAKLLDAGNGISTSAFRLYDSGGVNVTVSLNNFCKLQAMGPNDEDDILSCVHFLMVDVMSARRLVGGLEA
jgi:hypothetical protein